MIDNNQDLIDSRDIIDRIDELRAMDELDPAEAGELAALESVAEQAEGYAPDWEYGETLIRDSYFTEYAQQLADDCGMLDGPHRWPYTCIDWEQAARELQMDYTAIDFDGVTYWVR